MDEKRKKSRRESRRITKPLRILVFWEGKSGRHEADIYDVGIGGCFLNTAGEAEVGERVKVDIPKPTVDQHVVSFEGIVVPQKRSLKGFGMRFLPLTEEQQTVIGLFALNSQEFPDRRQR